MQSPYWPTANKKGTCKMIDEQRVITDLELESFRLRRIAARAGVLIEQQASRIRELEKENKEIKKAVSRLRMPIGTAARERDYVARAITDYWGDDEVKGDGVGISVALDDLSSTANGAARLDVPALACVALTLARAIAGEKAKMASVKAFLSTWDKGQG